MTHRMVTPEKGSRLEMLLMMHDQLKARADDAAAVITEYEDVRDAIKYELTKATANDNEAEEVTSMSVAYPPYLARPLRLAAVSSWRLDTKAMKEREPAVYVKYAVRTHSWRLTVMGADSK